MKSGKAYSQTQLMVSVFSERTGKFTMRLGSQGFNFYCAMFSVIFTSLYYAQKDKEKSSVMTFTSSGIKWQLDSLSGQQSRQSLTMSESPVNIRKPFLGKNNTNGRIL